MPFIDKPRGHGLLAPMTCVVCDAERPKDADESAAWRPLLGAMPLGAYICSDVCYNKARQRIAIHGRSDKPTEDEQNPQAGLPGVDGSGEPEESEEESEEERAETEPPPADDGDEP